MDVTKILGSAILETIDDEMSSTKILGASQLSTGPARLSVTKVLFAAILGPPLPETFNFILRVTDADGCVALKPCQVTIQPGG